MTAKHRDEPEAPTPPCTIGIGESQARVERAVEAERRAKRIGELNGPWAVLLKLTLIILPIFITLTFAWGTWVTSQIHKLDSSGAVTAQVLTELRVLSEASHRHEREIASLQSQFNVRTSARDREMDENRLAHSEIGAKLDRQSEKIDRLAERLASRQ